MEKVSPGAPTGIPGIFEPFDDESEDEMLQRLFSQVVVASAPLLLLILVPLGHCVTASPDKVSAYALSLLS